ncbi:MAG: DUF427 domain-containing protein [Deltaproteobacteria bacterium]
MKAVWEGKVLAESDKTVVIEGSHYFPPDSIRREYLTPSDTRTTCLWKGVASYYHLRVGDKSNPDAAWCYPEPKEAANSIKDHIAFWRGVKVTE